MKKEGIWKKLGLIFSPGQYDWMYTHAQNPLPELLPGGLIKVHFSTRDSRNRAQGAFFIFDINEPHKILDLSNKPTLSLGDLGSFDDAGVMPGSIVSSSTSKYLYYTGWSRTVDVPFAFHIGLAVTKSDHEIFSRVSRAPVLGRNFHDPFIVGAPYVLLIDGSFRMWYTSCTRWAEENGKVKHYYTVKHARSDDGIYWKCSDQLCLDYQKDEYAIARPVVWQTESGYKMWFTFRGGNDTYRIGVAESEDGISWRRHLEPLGIDVSDTGWDSEMICYAHPIVSSGRTYALYNGNSYGKSGIGLAELV